MSTKFAKSTILVVDDEPAGREVLYGLLTVDGYHVELAQNGIEALQKANTTTDLILLDVMMPDIDGFEVCRQLRQNPGLAEVPIIMLTALDDRDSLLEGIEAGADDFLSKPFDRQELRARVRTITRLNRFRRLVTERNKFQWVIDHADEGYLIIDNSGDIQYANRQARIYLNLPTDPNTPITQPFQTIVKKHFRREPKAAWDTRQILSPSSKQSPPRYLVRPETDTAHAFWLQVDFLPTSSAPAAHPTDWVIRLRDVTTKMLLQRDMWQFQAMISHKLRAPLVPVIGTANLLASEIENFSKEEVSQLAQQAMDGVARLHDTVEDIVRFTDITRQTPITRMDGVPVTRIEPMLRSLGETLEIAGITVSGNGLTADTTVAVPAETLNIVFQEILQNSKKFHPKNAPNIAITITANTDTVNVKIADDGVSLSPEQLKYIWTPYYQGEKFFTGESSGIGLGLPMVASLVWSMNGDCLAYNRNPAPGVVIELRLPTQEQQRGR